MSATTIGICQKCLANTELGDNGLCPKCATSIIEEMDWSSTDNPKGSLSQIKGPISVHAVLANYINECDITFTLNSESILPEQIIQPEVAMPVISLEAMRIWKDISKSDDSLGVRFEQSGSGLFPVIALAMPIRNDLASTLRLLTFTLATRRVLSLKEGQSIELIPFFAEWEKIDWNSTWIPDIPVPVGFDAEFMSREFTNKRVKERPAPESLRLPEEIVSNPFKSQLLGFED